MDKNKLRKLKESGKLKEFAYLMAENMLKEGNFEDAYKKNADDLYDVDSFLAALEDPKYAGRVGGERPMEEPELGSELSRKPDIGGGAFSTGGENGGMDDFSLDSDTYFDLADDPEPERTFKRKDPFPGSEEPTVAGIKKIGPKGRREVTPDSFRSMKELDQMEREDLKTRREPVKEGKYIIYNENNNEAISVEAANLQDAAIQASDMFGEDWGMITDESGTEHVQNTTRGDIQGDAMMERDREPTDKELDAIESEFDYDKYVDDFEDEYGSEDEYAREADLYTDDPSDKEAFDHDIYESYADAFDDGLYHHKLRDKVVIQESKIKVSLDDWGEFWNDRN